MQVIGVRTDAPSYNQGEGAITLTATVRADPGEQGMYKLQAYIKRSGETPTAWVAAGYELWGTPACMNCTVDVTGIIPVPRGSGKYVVAVLNTNNIETAPGATLDDMIADQGAYTYIDIIEQHSPPYGALEVLSNPSSADVIIDGNNTGRTTTAGVRQRFALVAGTHRLSLVLPGYAAFNSAVEIVPQRTTRMVATLQEAR